MNAWIQKLESLFAELLDHFKSHPAATTQAPAPVVPVEVVAAPVPPPVVPVVPQPINPGAPANTTDPTAPGFVMPANVAPPAAPAEPESEWNANMPYKSGTMTVPEAWWTGGGFVRALNDCEIHFQGGSGLYDIVVNQGSIPQAPSVKVSTVAGDFSFDLGSPSAQHAGTVEAGDIVVKLSQTGGCVVNLVRHG